MVTYMNENKLQTLDDNRRFLDVTVEVEFSIQNNSERYRWTQAMLVRFCYITLGKKDRGLMLL